MKRQPDTCDRHLISLLKADARQPVAALARAVGLSRSAVQERLARLERDGVIGGYTVRLGAGGTPALTAQVMIRVAPQQAAGVVAALAQMPACLRTLAISGEFDLIVECGAASAEDMDRLLDRIGALPGIQRTLSSIILSTKFDRR